MRTIGYILQKEFIQVFRNKAMLPLMFVMPLVQLLVLSYAATYELHEVKFYLVDQDKSQTTQRLVQHFTANTYFTLAEASADLNDAQHAMHTGVVDLIMHIPPNFERDLMRNQSAEMQFSVDGVEGTVAGLIQAYGQSILMDFNEEVMAEWNLPPEEVQAQQRAQITVTPSYWYNAELDYIIYMVPGILVVLVTMIGTFLTGMNIVRERELGTIEQLNVTPIKRYQFMIGKLLPFWIIAMAELAFGLFLAWLIFDIPMEGNLAIVFVVAVIYLIVIQGLGLLISTVSSTQQQAMFGAWFMMVVFILMGGLFTPIESMPDWAQQIAWLNPVSYFIRIMRMVLLKGSGLMDIWRSLVILFVMGSAVMSFAILRYRKTTS